jgi:hypothetical protein
VLRQERTYRAKGRFVSEEQRAARAECWRTTADNVRKALGVNALHYGSWTAIEAAKLQSLKWADLDTEERQQCAEAVHRAGIDLANALAARYDGDFNFEPKDKLLARALREDAASPSPASPSPKTEPAAQTGPIFSTVYPDYSRADAMTFRKTAERMPFDYGRAAAYRDLSPAEIIARYEALRKRFPVAT